jgi:hypothetical protein
MRFELRARVFGEVPIQKVNPFFFFRKRLKPQRVSGIILNVLARDVGFTWVFVRFAFPSGFL